MDKRVYARCARHGAMVWKHKRGQRMESYEFRWNQTLVFGHLCVSDDSEPIRRKRKINNIIQAS